MTKQTRSTLMLTLGFLLLSAALVAWQFKQTNTHLRLNGIEIDGAYATAPPVGRTFAAYMKLTADQADRLIFASAPLSRTVEFHDHVFVSDVVHMPKLTSIELAPGAVKLLKPGALHLMLLDVAPQVKVGDSLTLRLRFEHAGEIELQLPVRAAGGGHSH